MSFFTFIRTAQVGIRTTFGKYTDTVKPGLVFYVPFVQEIHKNEHKHHPEQFQVSGQDQGQCFFESQDSCTV